MQDFPEIIERMYAGYSFIFSLILLILSTGSILYLSSDEKEGIILKVLFFFALVFLNVSWLSSDHTIYKNIMFWAKVNYSMKVKERLKMLIINVIMISLF